jgi:hypothetical protein
MLLLPEGKQRSRQAAALPPPVMDDGVAGPTEGDEPAGGVAAGAAMVDGALVRCPTALTAAVVPGQNRLAMAGKAAARVSGLAVAAAAEPGDGGRAAATGATQGELAQLPQRSIIAEEKPDYH